MARRKTWSTTVQEHGITVRLYERERGGPLWLAVKVGRRISENAKAYTEQDRRRLGHRDRVLAEQQARALARELVDAKIHPEDRGDGSLTLGALFRAYSRVKLPKLSPDRQQYAQTAIELFLGAWREGLPVQDLGQDQVDDYVSKRRSSELLPPRLVPKPEGERAGRGYRQPRAVRDGTLDSNFRWLSSVFNWATRHKLNGKRLLALNPLHDCEWPTEKNPRRPVASEKRFQATRKHADAVDPSGRLRCMLMLARYTGRRERAICELRVSDVLLTPEQVSRVLAGLGMDERLAEHMPHGAIYWPIASDKERFELVSPLSRSAREALDEYLRKSPRLGDAPLFPSPDDAEKPIRRDVASSLLLRAEKQAKLPKLAGGVWHPYRRLWASERKHLPDVDVAAAGGWKDTRALKLAYQQPDPATMLRVVELG